MTSNHSATSPDLTLDQTRAFEEILEVFNTPGWARLHKRLITDRAAVDNVRTCTNLELAKGQLGVLDAIIAWPETWAALYEAAKAGDVEIEEGAFA